MQFIIQDSILLKTLSLADKPPAYKPTWWKQYHIQLFANLLIFIEFVLGITKTCLT